jgi:16S rRNA (guanine(966)-N(2))-methyltransferase RsmD
VRVIAGALKGRRLKPPTWQGLRPTSDKLRETLFNIVAPRIGGARVLDGYAGTGAIGIEALSRGAAAVTFVDRDRRAHALIADNLARCGVTQGYAIIRASLTAALDGLRSDHRALDLILLDPPYDEGDAQVTAALSRADDLLAPGGLVVLEHARRRAMPAGVGRLDRVRQVTCGDSVLSFYEVKRQEVTV